MKRFLLLSETAHAVVRRLPPEAAHRLTIRALAFSTPRPMGGDDPRLAIEAFGLKFPNPIGLAAGFDKNGEAVDAVLGMGFGFVEAGTVTPQPQLGNPRPRLFRLPHDGGVINRLGFNSRGHQFVHRRLAARSGKSGIVAVNLGANKDSEDRIADYVAGVRTFADVASFFVINISSPNTPGLRDLQRQQALSDLLPNVLAARDTASRHVPVIVKIAPDLTLHELDGIVRVCKTHRIDGLAISNTTLSRPETLVDRDIGKQHGGLSGRPLFHLSTWVLAQAFLRIEGAFPLIGIGGVEDVATALAKIEAGAHLVELYSALVYKGAGLVREIKDGLLARFSQTSAPLDVLRGARADDWAANRISVADVQARA